MYKKTLFLIALVGSVSGPAHAISKCTGADGKVVFQDAPCEGKGDVLNVRPASGERTPTPSATPPQASWQSKSAESDKRTGIRLAMERREAVVGMSFQELEQAMGLPNRVNTGEYQTSSTQQRIYERGGTTWYVYTNGQFVTAVQSLQTPGAKKSPVSCPSAHEIRSAETSASSISLSDLERVERQKQIRDMRNCGK